MVLRDDNAGLGVQKGKSNADTFGLATLSGIFGRLNGKSEVEVQKQADTVRDLELQTYQSQKWGLMNFVYGGLLVGDKMEEDEKKRLAEHNANFMQSKRKAEDETPADTTASKKRKHYGAEKSDAASESSDESDAESKESKKKKKRSKKGEAATNSSSETATKASKKERKEKHKKDSKSADSSDKCQAKEEKRARKEARRKRREEKQARKVAKGKASAQTSRDQSSESSSDEDAAPAAKPTTPSFASGRLAVRQRYIMQKRQAGMNPQAMAEILMLKAGA